jgi:hypothetical protein
MSMMNPDQKIDKLTERQAKELLRGVTTALWWDGTGDTMTYRWNPGKEWDSGIGPAVAEILKELAPPDEPCAECGSEMEEYWTRACTDCGREAGT